MGLGTAEDQHATKLRAIFSKFFYTENLIQATPLISKIWEDKLGSLQQSFERLHEEFPPNYKAKEQLDDGFRCVNFRTILIKIFSQIIDEVLFGCGNDLRVQGMSIPEAIDRVFHMVFLDSAMNPLNALFGGYPHSLNLLASSRAATKLGQEIVQEININFELRAKKPLDQLGDNILDLMAKHNKTCQPGEALSIDDVASNCILFYIASVDTSKAVMEFLLCDFVANPQNQTIFFEKVASKIPAPQLAKYESYADNSTVQDFTKEAMRLYSPSGLLFPRVVTKEFKVGKYTFHKGAHFTVIFTHLHLSENHYPNSKSLQIDRFAKKEEEQKSRLPLPAIWGSDLEKDPALAAIWESCSSKSAWFR